MNIKWKSLKFFYFFIFLFCPVILLNAKDLNSAKGSVEFKINSLGPIQSFDPIDHDAFNSMVIFKNVNPRLVSLGHAGPPSGYLSSSWRVTNDKKNWVFTIRPGIKFDDGQMLDASVIGKNLKRIVWLTRNEGLSLNQALAGITNWKNLKDPLDGIEWTVDELHLNFAKAPEDLLELLEQPLYGVIPITSFDGSTGLFKAGRPASAGAYRILDSDEEKLILERNNFWNFHGPSRIRISWKQISLDTLGAGLKPYDLIILNGSNITRDFIESMKNKDIKILSNPPFLMNFVELQPTHGLFKGLAVRQAFRNIFYRNYFSSSSSNKYFTASNSFIPKGGVGYLEFPVDLTHKLRKLNSQTVTLIWWPPFPFDKANSFILDTITKTTKEMGLSLRIVKCADRGEMVKALRANDFDIIVRMTGLLVHKPFADMQMMFLSKTGALIPDVTGHIGNYLAEAKKQDMVSARQALAQRINAQVHEDSSIITYSHSGFAYAYNPKEISLESYNLFNDPFDMTAIEKVAQ